MPNPNNGTLRLPLKPIGVHSVDTSPAVPDDPVPSDTIISIDPIESSSAADETLKAPTMVSVDNPDTPPVRPAVTDESTNKDQSPSDKAGKFWDYINGKLSEWKTWAAGIVGVKEGEADGTETANIEGKKGGDSDVV